MKKYQIRLLYDVEGWAYYWRCKALQKYAPEDFDVTIGSNYGKQLISTKCDLILQLCYSHAKDVRQFIDKHNLETILVSSYNIGWGYANPWLDPVIKYSDFVIINNKEMWEKSGKHEKTINISNGVDLNTFYIKKPIELRKPRVLWVGSHFHRKTKNYNTILVPLEKLLNKDGIATDFKLTNSHGKYRLTSDQMNIWYNSGTIYVIASNTEGTPNPGLESSAAGCVPVSTRVGNMPELIQDGVNGYLCGTSIDSLYHTIKKAMLNYIELSNNMQTTIKSWDWKVRSVEYYNLFRDLIKNKGL